MSNVVNETSPWKFLSFALVTKDNTEGSDIIEVWPYELLPFEDGDVSKNTVAQEQDVVDFYGAKKKVKVDRESKLEAKWYPTTDGRFTPPNVVTGETVEIYQYGQEDIYRWVSNGRQPELRRLEHVTHAYSNLKSGRASFDGKSSYGYTFSTREKYVRFWTRKSDGEQFEYQLLFDTDKNKILLHDDIGNAFGLLSADNDIYMRNSVNSYVRLLEASVQINASRDVIIRAPKVYVDGDLIVTGQVKADGVHTNNLKAGSYSGPHSDSPTPLGGVSAPGLPGIGIQTEFEFGDDIEPE